MSNLGVGTSHFGEKISFRHHQQLLCWTVFQFEMDHNRLGSCREGHRDGKLERFTWHHKGRQALPGIHATAIRPCRVHLHCVAGRVGEPKRMLEFDSLTRLHDDVAKVVHEFALQSSTLNHNEPPNRANQPGRGYTRQTSPFSAEAAHSRSIRARLMAVSNLSRVTSAVRVANNR
jgi:hypothetical protein